MTGWIIWEDPGLLVEAEFHVVWADPGGNLVDVTPKPDGEQRILFVRDSSVIWDFSAPVGNKRKFLVDTLQTRQLAEINSKLDALRARYWKEGGYEIPSDELIKIYREVGFQ